MVTFIKFLAWAVFQNEIGIQYSQQQHWQVKKHSKRNPNPLVASHENKATKCNIHSYVISHKHKKEKKSKIPQINQSKLSTWI